MLRLGLLLALILLVGPVTNDAQAACTCRCVNGVMQSVCTRATDLPLGCPPQHCPLPPPSMAPATPDPVPSAGYRECAQRQVLDPATGRYQWQRICF